MWFSVGLTREGASAVINTVLPFAVQEHQGAISILNMEARSVCEVKQTATAETVFILAASPRKAHINFKPVVCMFVHKGFFKNLTTVWNLSVCLTRHRFDMQRREDLILYISA